MGKTALLIIEVAHSHIRKCSSKCSNNIKSDIKVTLT